jgi:hypothetical protein
MSFYQQSLIEYAYEKVRAASHILRAHANFRSGIPEAWACALMRLKAAHIPPAAKVDFAFLSNEMSRCLECGLDGRLKFMETIDDDALDLIEAAYWRLHMAIVNWLTDSLRDLLASASRVDPSKELVLVNAVLDDAALWEVAEHAERIAPPLHRLTDWQPTGAAH